MKENRRLSRIVALKVLFSFNFNGLFNFKTPGEKEPGTEFFDLNTKEDLAAVESHLKNYMENLATDEERQLSPQGLAFSFELIKGVCLNQDTIIRKIKENSAHWRIERMASADRTILMLACFELLFLKLEPKIAINEAVELSKLFCSQDAKSFVNGILDAIKNAS